MNILLLPFLVISLMGLVLSVTAHILSVLGIVPPGGELVMGLHMGIFVVWLPTVLVMVRISKGTSRKYAWKVALSGCPQSVRYALYALFGYAFLNFFLFASTQKGGHSATDGVTPEVIRGFSGHWMIFYAAASATLFSVWRKPELLLERKCCNGHVVSQLDSFCSTCGSAVEKKSHA